MKHQREAHTHLHCDRLPHPRTGGRRITLSGGAIGSPSILLRFGVGPSDEIKAVGDRAKPVPQRGRPQPGRPGYAAWNAVPGPVDESAQCFQVLMRYTALGSNVANDMQIVPS
jgi:choline dehydrogenase